MWITYYLITAENWFWHHRVSLVKAVRNIYMMTLKGQFVNLTWGQVRSRSGGDPGRSCCISVDAAGRTKHNGAYFTPLSLFYPQLLIKNCRDLAWPGVTFLRGHRTTNTPWMSRMAQINMFWLELGRFVEYSRNRKHLNFPPLTYNGEVTKLTWPQVTDMKNPRYTIC
jgi:hypothetical protein